MCSFPLVSANKFYPTSLLFEEYSFNATQIPTTHHVLLLASYCMLKPAIQTGRRGIFSTSWTPAKPTAAALAAKGVSAMSGSWLQGSSSRLLVNEMVFPAPHLPPRKKRVSVGLQSFFFGGGGILVGGAFFVVEKKAYAKH